MVDEAHQALSKFRQGSRYQRSFVGALAAMGKQQACCSLISSQEWAFGMDVKAEVKWNCYPRRRNVKGANGGYLPAVPRDLWQLDRAEALARTDDGRRL